MSTHLDPASLLRAARARAGLSQRVLAERVGTSQSVVARIELGQTSPTVATLNRLLAGTGHEIEIRLAPTAEGYRARATTYFERDAPEGLVASFLYGSTARGSRNKQSDVDIGVLVEHERYPDRLDRSRLRVRLAAELVAALGTNDVDVVVLNDLPPGLATRIVLDGTLLGVRDPERLHAFTRDVQLRLGDLVPFLRRNRRLKREALARTDDQDPD